MFCSNCGKEITTNAAFCSNCGSALHPTNHTMHTQQPIVQAAPAAQQAPVADVPNTGLNIISFLIPLVGLILYIVYHEKTPVKAKAIGKWALIGFILGVVGQVLLLFLI